MLVDQLLPNVAVLLQAVVLSLGDQTVGVLEPDVVADGVWETVNVQDVAGEHVSITGLHDSVLVAQALLECELLDVFAHGADDL